MPHPSRPAPRPGVASPSALRLVGALLLAASCGGEPEPPPEGTAPVEASVEASVEAPVEAPAAAPAVARTPAAGAERGSEPSPAWEGPFVPDGFRTALPAWEAGKPGFPDQAAARGVDYGNRSGEPHKPTVLEANGAGVAALDLGGDGDDDLVFAQGLESLAALRAGPGADLAVFLNDGSGTFAPGSAPGLSGWWTGFATGDVDGDGDADLVAGGFGDLVLCEQTADGALRPRTATGLLPSEEERPGARFVPGRPPEPSPASGAEGEGGGDRAAPLWATSLALFDADRDGTLDLYVGQYLALDPWDPPLGELGEGALAVPCTWKGRPVFCGPRGLEPQPDRLLRGRGDGTFEDATRTWLGDDLEAGFTLAVAPFDADRDGDTDLYVAHDSVPNQLLVNHLDEDSLARFVDRAGTAGVAVGSEGQAEAGMGIAVGDVDGDGRPDFAVTNFSDEPTRLYLGAAQGFRLQTHGAGLGHETRRLLSWSAHLEDFDGDGWLELFTTNGHVYPQADDGETGTRYAQADSLWRLAPAPRAVRVAPRVRDSILATPRGTRGSAVADFDRDGTPDLALAHLDAPAGLGLNHLDDGAHRLWLRLLGPTAPTKSKPRTPRDGTGAQVVVVVRTPSGAERGLWGEVQTAEGFQSASTPWLHFGLGDRARYEAIHVSWPSGARDVLPGGPAGRRLWIREGAGVERTEAFR